MTWRVGLVLYTYKELLGVVCVQYVCENMQERSGGLFPEAAVSVAPVVSEAPLTTQISNSLSLFVGLCYFLEHK